MKLNTLKKTVAAAVVSVGLAQPAAAWDVVFDPTAVMQAVQQLAQLKAQYEQLKQQYQAVTGNGGYANG
ncbi:MAG: type IV secretion system protein, partial [Neisseria animaloris]|nr:type IV secretion system protein [Neisseria animaloris]